ncbi:MAG: 50S ribosomal protein L11 methyltransferase [Verrucomicrobiae bacterium]|nr:50S ribosomal protein L11 methyltransferase [Verrucomicrobiae bacterium]
MNQLPAKILCWRKISGTRTLDALTAQLAHIDPQRLILSQNPPSRVIRVEVYPESRSAGLALVRKFGGKLLELTPRTWWAPQEPRAEPLRIGTKIIVVVSEEQRRVWHQKFPSRPILNIPASLAFGTGEHATTAMMLRLLGQVPDWEQKRFLDIGTGTGILALAARALGCRDIEAFDNDPRAIRVARENDRLNPGPRRTRIPWQRLSVADFKPRKKFDVVAANLFSDLLIAHHKRLIRALKPGGQLLLSGIFRDHVPLVLPCYRRAGLTLLTQRMQGRWCALRWKKS